MNRLHVHLHVNDIAESVRFYTTFSARSRRSARATTPNGCSTIRRVNFAISSPRHAPQASTISASRSGDDAELEAISERKQKARPARS